MARQNYFEILEQMDFDPDKEFKFSTYATWWIKSPYTTESIRDVFNRNFWLYENYRKMQFRSYDEAKDYFNNNFNGPDRLFTYIEFIIDLNSFMISNGKILTFTKATLIKEFPKVRERIDYCLAKNNHELKELENGRQIIVEKNVYASEVSQIISESNIEDAIKVLEYNHFSNKGDIQRKKEILISLANYLEPLRDELNAFEELKEVMKVNSKKIIAVDKLFDMYNNLGLRHNNSDQYHLEMTEEELEQWYDDIYTSTLFVILSLDEARILSKLKTLRNG